MTVRKKIKLIKTVSHSKLRLNSEHCQFDFDIVSVRYNNKKALLYGNNDLFNIEMYNEIVLNWKITFKIYLTADETIKVTD